MNRIFKFLSVISLIIGSFFIFNINYVKADSQTLGATWSRVCFDKSCANNEVFYQGQGKSDINQVVPVIYFYFYGDYNTGTQKFNKDTLYTLSINFSLYLVGEERPVNASEISSLFSEYEFGAGITGESDMSGSLIKIQNYGFYNGTNNSVEFRIQFKPTQTVNFTRFTLKYNKEVIWNFHYNKASLNGVTNSMEAINDLNQSIIIGNQNIINNQNQNQQQTNEKLDNLNKSVEDTNKFLKDDTEPNSDISSLGNVQGLLPAGPVDTLLNIPFTFLSVVNNSLSGTCVPLTGTFVFNSTLTIPCFGSMFYDNVPEGLMVFINLIPSAFLLISYFKHLYKKVDRAVSLQSTDEDEWGVL